jgi:hypothetical protein
MCLSPFSHRSSAKDSAWCQYLRFWWNFVGSGTITDGFPAGENDGTSSLPRKNRDNGMITLLNGKS